MLTGKLVVHNIKTADVRVTSANTAYGDVPYTVQSGGCGQQGDFIHLTPNYLQTLLEQNNIALFGPSGNHGLIVL